MSDRLPRSLLLPELPRPLVVGHVKDQPISIEYVRKLTDSLKANHIQVAERIEELTEVGDAADLPDASGAGRFFFEQDTDKLKFDDGTWNLVGGLGGFLPLTAGSSYPLTGNLYIDKTADPSLYLREGGAATSYVRIYDNGVSGLFEKHEATGESAIFLEPYADDGAGNSSLNMFRSVSTTGSRRFQIYQGDGSATIQHAFNAGDGDADLCQQAGQATIGGTDGTEKLTVIGDVSIGDGGTTNYVKVDSNKLLSFQGTADIAAAIDQTICLSSYIDKKERGSSWNLHGNFISLDTGSPLDSVPTDIVVTAGISKLVIVVNAGADLDGDITVTGTSVNRNTGAETAADTDTITVDALTTDASSADAEGNVRHSFTGAYITSKWFKGNVTLSTTNLTLTDVDTWQVAFEQVNDNANVELTTADQTLYATNVAAWYYSNLYILRVTGDKCNITREGSLELPTADVSANTSYRIRRGNLGKTFDGTTDGFWAELFPGPLNQNYWEDVNVKFWFEIKAHVYGESS